MYLAPFRTLLLWQRGQASANFLTLRASKSTWGCAFETQVVKEKANKYLPSCSPTGGPTKASIKLIAAGPAGELTKLPAGLGFSAHPLARISDVFPLSQQSWVTGPHGKGTKQWPGSRKDLDTLPNGDSPVSAFSLRLPFVKWGCLETLFQL